MSIDRTSLDMSVYLRDILNLLYNYNSKVFIPNIFNANSEKVSDPKTESTLRTATFRTTVRQYNH